ncbi:MAG: hypothetical protein ACJ748_12170 [Flavisolibacter sp.]
MFLIYNKKNKKEKILLAITLYCCVDILINCTTQIFSSGYITYVAYSFFTAFEYLVFAWCFWLIIENKVFKKAIAIISTLFVLFLIVYYCTTKPRSIDSIPIGLETIIILLYSFYYLYEQMNNTANLFIYNKYQFWIVTGIMIYLSGSFFIYIFANQIDRKLLMRFWFLTNAFYVLKNVFFAIGILIHVKQEKSILPRNPVLI